MKIKSVLGVILLATAVVGLALPCCGDVAYEGFDYAGGTAITTADGGTGFSDAWSVAAGTVGIDGTSLQYTGMQTTGGSLTVGDWGMATRSLTTPLTDGTTAWMGFLMRFNGPVPAAADYAGVSFGGTTPNTSGTFAGMGENGTAWGITQSNWFSIRTCNPTIVNDKVYFFVLQLERLDLSNTQVSLFVNPTIGDSPGVAVGTGTYSTGDIGGIGLLANMTFEEGAYSASFDEFRLGSSYAEMLVVPEPGTMTILALGGLGLVGMRRRRPMSPGGCLAATGGWKSGRTPR